MKSEEYNLAKCINFMDETIKQIRSENQELKMAIKDYFEVWANKEKKPGWCKRTEQAKKRLMKLIA